MKPGDLFTHNLIPSSIYMYLSPDIQPGSKGRFTDYQLKMVRVIQLGDPHLHILRFHQSYLKPIPQ